MEVEIIPTEDFEPFILKIRVNNKDELHNLTMAVGRMTNGHGINLYDKLRDKCQEFGVKL